GPAPPARCRKPCATRETRAAGRRRCRRPPGGSCRRATSGGATLFPLPWACRAGSAGRNGTGASAAKAHESRGCKEIQRDKPERRQKKKGGQRLPPRNPGG